MNKKNPNKKPSLRKRMLDAFIKRAARETEKIVKHDYGLYYQATDANELASRFMNGDIVGALIGSAANACLTPDPNLCDALERERKSLLKHMRQMEEPYHIFKFSKMNSIVSHDLMHEVAQLVFNVLHDNEDDELKRVGLEMARVAVINKLSLAEKLTPNFAILAILLADELDEGQCADIHQRMIQILRTDKEAAMILDQTEELMSEMGPNMAAFSSLGACVITMNQSAQIDQTAVVRLLDEFDTMLWDLSVQRGINTDASPF